MVRNDVPFGHSNYTAGALLLVLPWLALAAWRTAGLRRLAWSLAALAAGAGLLATGSRAGVLALAGVSGLATLFGCWKAPWPRRTKLALALGALLLVALAVLANPRLRELVTGGGWSDIARESNTQRGAMLAAGIALGTERPLLGWGPGHRAADLSARPRPPDRGRGQRPPAAQHPGAGVGHARRDRPARAPPAPRGHAGTGCAQLAEPRNRSPSPPARPCSPTDCSRSPTTSSTCPRSTRCWC
jgi:hypothetical protein